MVKKDVFSAVFRRRLVRLYREIGLSLAFDSPTPSLWSCLFSVYSFLWCSGFSRCTKKIFIHD